MKNIYDATFDAGMKNTLFIVVSDHGGTPWNGNGASHGGWSDAEKLVTFAAVGKGVRKTELDNVNIRDLAAVVLYAFGIDPPEFSEDGWTSQIPNGMFDDDSIPEYRDISNITGAEPRVSRFPHKSELIL